MKELTDILNIKVQMKQDGAIFYITGVVGNRRNGIEMIKVDNRWYMKEQFEDIFKFIV